ncbi:MAG: hypothetical protein AAGC92_16970, partial [Pseudomonadota bacterium]
RLTAIKWKRAGGRYIEFPTLLIDVAKRRNEVLVAFPGVPRRKRLSVPFASSSCFRRRIWATPMHASTCFHR